MRGDQEAERVRARDHFLSSCMQCAALRLHGMMCAPPDGTQVNTPLPRPSAAAADNDQCAPLQRRCDALVHSHHVSESTLNPTPHPTQRYSTVHASLKRWSRKPSSTSRTWILVLPVSVTCHAERAAQARKREGRRARAGPGYQSHTITISPPFPPLHAVLSFTH